MFPGGHYWGCHPGTLSSVLSHCNTVEYRVLRWWNMRVRGPHQYTITLLSVYLDSHYEDNRLIFKVGIAITGNAIFMLKWGPKPQPGASNRLQWLDLTHCGLSTPYGDIELGQHWLRQWLVAWRHQAITWTNVDLSVRSPSINPRALSSMIWRYQSVKQGWKLHFYNYIQIFQGTMS